MNPMTFRLTSVLLRPLPTAVGALVVFLAATAGATDAEVLEGFGPRIAGLEADTAALSAIEYDSAGVSVGALSAQLDGARGAFEWVRDNTTLDPYVGVLRGARGTLFTRGGNTLDRALLLGELVGARGSDWTIATGDLTDDAARLIAATVNVDGALEGTGVSGSVAEY